MNLKTTLLLLLLSSGYGLVNAQVGIGTTTPNADAQLDITTTNKGLLLPRIALTNTTSPAPLTADVAGMTVYNTATAGDVTPGMYYNNGTIWVRIPQTLTRDWALSGNAGTTNGTDFLGTTDAQDLDIRTNNVIHQRFTQKGQLEFLNTNSSVLIGQESGDLSTGNLNTVVGHRSMINATSGSQNTVLGGFVMFSATDAGVRNTAVGYQSMGSGSFGGGDENTGIGGYSLYAAGGDHNSALGHSALRRLNAGDHNVAVGYESDYDLAAGSNNVAIGYRAGGLTGAGGTYTRSNNVFIGANSGTSEANSNRLHIENTTSLTPLVYGEFDNNILRIGGQLQIGNSDDATIGSVYTFPTTAGANGQVLQLNATGDLTWQNNGSDTDDWNLLGNAGTNSAINFIGTTDAQDLVFRTNNTQRIRVTGATGNIGIHGNPQLWAKTFSQSVDSTLDAFVGYHSANGYGVYGRAEAGYGTYGQTNSGRGAFGFDIGTGIGVQGQVNNVDAVGMVAVNQAEGTAIYAQTSGAGTSASTSYGVYATINQATDSGNENSAPVVGINVTRVDGTGYSGPLSAGTASAVGGVVGVVGSKFTNSNGNEYLFGVIGDILVDSSIAGTTIPDASGGVLGTNGQGDFGILGYQAQNGTHYSVYGGNSAGNIAGGAGRVSQSSNTIGLGVNSGFMGGYLAGSQFGLISKGEQFGSYTMGNTIVNSPIVQLDDVNETNRVATYASMSTSVDVTSRGKGQLANGTTFIPFDKNYAKLIDVNNININITPMGETKGVYVTNITANGFSVKENMSGNSNAPFNWTAVATKKNFNDGVKLSNTVLSANFDKKMNGVMHNDGEETSMETTPIHYNGNEVIFQRAADTKGNSATIIKKDFTDLNAEKKALESEKK